MWNRNEIQRKLGGRKNSEIDEERGARQVKRLDGWMTVQEIGEWKSTVRLWQISAGKEGLGCQKSLSQQFW